MRRVTAAPSLGSLARAIGGGIGGFFSNAVTGVGNAIRTVFSQIERVVPGAALPVVLLAILAVVLAWNVARH